MDVFWAGALAAEGEPSAPVDVAELETAGCQVIGEALRAARQAHNRLERLILEVELRERQAKVDAAIGRRQGELQQPLQQPLLVRLEVVASMRSVLNSKGRTSRVQRECPRTSGSEIFSSRTLQAQRERPRYGRRKRLCTDSVYRDGDTKGISIIYAEYFPPMVSEVHDS